MSDQPNREMVKAKLQMEVQAELSLRLPPPFWWGALVYKFYLRVFQVQARGLILLHSVID